MTTNNNKIDHEHEAAAEIDPPTFINADTEDDEVGEDYDVVIAKRIVHILKIYPKISRSMLQMGIGPQHQAKYWKPVLQDLIRRKIVNEDFLVGEGPTGRHQTYTILSLNDDTV